MLCTEISVSKQYNFPSSNMPVLSLPKTDAGKRTVPIPVKARDYLNFDELAGRNLLFTDGTEPMTYTRVRDLSAALIARAFGEETDITLHCLRHNYCTMLFEQGVELMTVKEIVGHSDIKTNLSIYAHYTETIKKRDEAKVVLIG